jgi:Domain of unknown function (DUF1906)
MTEYWVEFTYDMVEIETGPNDPAPPGNYTTPVTFMGNTVYGPSVTPVPYSTYPFGEEASDYSFVQQGNWVLVQQSNGLSYQLQATGIIWFQYTIGIETSFVAGSQPAPTTLIGPTLSESVPEEAAYPGATPGTYTVQWTSWAWEEINVNSPSPSLTVTPPSQSKPVQLAWSQTTGGLKATANTGTVSFTDTDVSANPTASLVGNPTITVTNIAGQAVTPNSFDQSLLQSAYSETVTGSASNGVYNGNVSWNFSYTGNFYDLDFLAGKNVTVTDTVQVSDQDGQSATATVTNTLSMPAYAGIDYRYNSANDPLVPSDIKSSGIGLVGEYIGGASTSSYLTLGKAKQYIAAGLGIFSIYEKGAMNSAAYFNSSSSYQNGLADGKNAIAAAKRDGQASGAAIYFGIDYDPGTNLAGVVTYFQGVDAAFAGATNSAHYTVGVYGAGTTLQTIKDTDGLATYGDLAESTGWTGSKTYANWNLEQIYDPSLIGSTNFPNTSDFSQFSYIAGDLTNGMPTGASTSINLVAANVKGDLTGAGSSDVLWYNASTGNVGDWQLNNSAAQWTGIGTASTTVAASGEGDFFGNGITDVLWQNPTNNLVGDWQLTNGVPVWQVIGQGSTTMNIAGVGDFDGNGTSDILWQNPTNNLVGEWQMNNNVPTWQLIGQGSTSMNIAGIGDFNGDGTSDILWENPTNNLVGMWAMNGSTPTWSLIDQGSTTMKIVGVGDFTGSGTDDVLWENPANGTVGFWGMANGQDTSWNVVSTANTAYQVAGIGDYNGDGTSDILWRNPTTGDTGIWAMNNGQATWHDLGATSTAYKPVA